MAGVHGVLLCAIRSLDFGAWHGIGYRTVAVHGATERNKDLEGTYTVLRS